MTTGVDLPADLVGATMRHTDAGLAIPDFPLAFGQLIPPHWDAKIAIHFAHRVGALVVSRADPRHDRPRLYHHRRRGELVAAVAAAAVLCWRSRSRSAR